MRLNSNVNLHRFGTGGAYQMKFLTLIQESIKCLGRLPVEKLTASQTFVLCSASLLLAGAALGCIEVRTDLIYIGPLMLILFCAFVFWATRSVIRR